MMELVLILLVGLQCLAGLQRLMLVQEMVIFVVAVMVVLSLEKALHDDGGGSCVVHACALLLP